MQIMCLFFFNDDNGLTTVIYVNIFVRPTSNRR